MKSNKTYSNCLKTIAVRIILATTVLVTALVTALVEAANVVLPVGEFSAGDLTEWESQSFLGETVYKLVEVGDRQVLRADSRATASGLVRKISVNLNKTPYLNWSWRIANTLENVDEITKQGDDYSARIYVVVSDGVLFWRTRALVYVWSSSQPVGSTWHSAYTKNARIIALRSGVTEAESWVTEKRNVRADFQRLFGDSIAQIDAVALMTDTDNTGQAATAWYGDIYFSTD